MSNKDLESRLAQILSEIFPEESWDDSVEKTAARVLKSWREFTRDDEFKFLFTTFPAVSNQMIIVRDIQFSSLCAHHLLPFSGVVHVAYIPEGLQVGLSKIPRLVEYLSTCPQVQERLTHEIATTLQTLLHPQGVAVLIESQHTCMSCRGIRAHTASMATSQMTGCFLNASDSRSEFLSIVHKHA